MPSVLSLEKFAAVSARLDAGLPKDAVLKEAGLNQQQWEAELFTWLTSLSEQIQRHNYELYQRYTQWFLQNRLEAERQLGLQSAPNVASLPPAQRNESGDWEYMRWKQQEQSAQGSSAVQAPALVAPPALVGGVPPMPRSMPSYSPVPPMPPLPGSVAVPPMPSVGGGMSGSSASVSPSLGGASGVPPMPSVGGVSAVPPMSVGEAGSGLSAAPSSASAPSLVSAPALVPGATEPALLPGDRVSPASAAGSDLYPDPHGDVSPPPFVSGAHLPEPGYAAPPPHSHAAPAQATASAAPYVPTLSLGDYAMLAAEIAVVPEQIERALGKYGIGDPRAWEAIQQTWTQKLRADGYEQEAYQERFDSAQRHWRSVYKR